MSRANFIPFPMGCMLTRKHSVVATLSLSGLYPGLPSIHYRPPSRVFICQSRIRIQIIIKVQTSKRHPSNWQHMMPLNIHWTNIPAGLTCNQLSIEWQSLENNASHTQVPSLITILHRPSWKLRGWDGLSVLAEVNRNVLILDDFCAQPNTSWYTIEPLSSSFIQSTSLLHIPLENGWSVSFLKWDFPFVNNDSTYLFSPRFSTSLGMFLIWWLTIVTHIWKLRRKCMSSISLSW